MRFKSFLFLILIILLVALPSLTAIGLSGNKLGTIAFHPGTTITNHYVVSGTSNSIDINLNSGPFQDITIDNLEGNEFDLVIHFLEDESPATGSYTLSLTVREKPGSTEASIGSLTAASKTFTIVVYSYEKEIKAFLSAPNVNEGTPVNFQLLVNSMTYQDIDAVKGEIKVYNREKKLLKKLFTDEQALPSLGSVTLSAPSFDTKNLPADEYSAQALVFYDGQQKQVETTFKIGELNLLLQNYTRTVEPGFNDFFVQVANNWGDELRNVYAKIFLYDQEILQTPSITLGPWQEGELKGIAKIDFLPGTYSGKIQLFFEGEMKEEPISVMVMEAEKLSPESSVTLLIIIIIVLGFLFLAASILFFFQKQKLGKIKKGPAPAERKNEKKK